jgi:WD40 repeat protein
MSQRAGERLGQWSGGKGTLASLAYSPDGCFLASGHLAKLGNVRIWKATGRRLTVLDGHTDRVYSVAFSRDRHHLASGGNDGTIRLWEVGTWRPVHVFLGTTAKVQAIAFSPGGRALATADGKGDVRIWDIPQCERLETPARVLHGRAPLMAVT